jgi:iron complex outermembrane receptor protein
MNMTRLQAGAWAAIATAVPLVAGAQDDQQSEDILGELVVTAQKRETNLQDVPFSVAAQTGEQIRNSGATNIAEFARNIAGLTITDLGPGQSQVAIRGISAGQVVRDQPGVKEQVGIYLDESPISVSLFTPDLDLFDLERIEVLRGPQGTLFGAGSSSGTVRYITARPELGVFGGSAELSAAEGTDSDVGGAVKGAVNLPLGETAALRLVGYYNEIAGFMDAVQPDGSVKEDVDGGSKLGARVALRLQPSDSFSITPRVVYQELDTDGYPRIDIYNILGNPFTTTEPAVNLGEREQFTQQDEGLEDDFMMADLTIDLDIGGATLTSVTTYTDRDVVVLRDASQLTGSVTFDVGGTDAEVRLPSPLFDTTEYQAMSQELRLASSEADGLAWLIGVFYQDIDKEYGQNLPTPGYDAITQRLFGVDSADFLAPPDTPFFSNLTYDFQQLAVFGEATFQLSDKFSVTGGLRYYDFEEDRDLFFAGFFSDPSVNGPGSTSSDGYSPRVILEYEANDNVMFTLQGARGFRLGGINDPLNLSLCTPEDEAIFGGREGWEDEVVTNFELGTKTQSSDGRILFNAAVFYSDIEDLQANADAGSCSSRIVFNAQAEAIGGEVELFARPNDNWDFGVSATYVQAEITETQRDANGNVIAGLEEGNRLPTAPELQAAASVTYTMPVMSTRDFYTTFTVQHVGSSFTQIADQVAGFETFTLRQFGGPLTQPTFTFDPELPSYEIGNLRLGIRDERWEVAAFVNNVWDERAFLSVDRERGRGARVGYLTNRPTTYGLSLRVDF